MAGLAPVHDAAGAPLPVHRAWVFVDPGALSASATICGTALGRSPRLVERPQELSLSRLWPCEVIAPEQSLGLPVLPATIVLWRRIVAGLSLRGSCTM